MRLLLVLVLLGIGGCGDSLKLECVDGSATLNGRKFNCSVCKEEQGCTKSGNEWICPVWVSLDCTYRSSGGVVCGRNCCGGECITCSQCK